MERQTFAIPVRRNLVESVYNLELTLISKGCPRLIGSRSLALPSFPESNLPNSMSCELDMKTTRITAQSWVRLFLGLAFLACFASVSLCCSIPVFRYALEHWTPEPFIVSVISKSEFSAAESTLFHELTLSGKEANIQIKSFDGKSDSTDYDKRIARDDTSRDSAWLVVESAKRRDSESRVIWDGPFTSESVSQLLDSPVRKQICDGLADKISVAWVFLESGQPSVDDPKFAKLESELRRLENEILLPVIEESDLKDLSKKPEELKLRFAVHRISRNDQDERAFTRMLLATEPDLQDEFANGAPMAFPIFGRGRVLYALVGEGIATATIEESCRFLAGACQCTVKADNPGVDVLFSYPWDERVQITAPKKDEIQVAGIMVPIPSKTRPTAKASETAGNASMASDTSKKWNEKPTKLPMAQPFTLFLLGALASVMGSLTLGWIFASRAKSSVG